MLLLAVVTLWWAKSKIGEVVAAGRVDDGESGKRMIRLEMVFGARRGR